MLFQLLRILQLVSHAHGVRVRRDFRLGSVKEELRILQGVDLVQVRCTRADRSDVFGHTRQTDRAHR